MSFNCEVLHVKNQFEFNFFFFKMSFKFQLSKSIRTKPTTFLKNIFLADYGLGEFLLAIDFLFFNYFFKKDKRLGEIQINVLTNNIFNLNINFIQRKV